MTELLGFLEPWCDDEQVLEDGETFEEEKQRQEIYTHHLEAQVDLETDTAAAAAAAELLVLKPLTSYPRLCP